MPGDAWDGFDALVSAAAQHQGRVGRHVLIVPRRSLWPSRRMPRQGPDRPVAGCFLAPARYGISFSVAGPVPWLAAGVQSAPGSTAGLAMGLRHVSGDGAYADPSDRTPVAGRSGCPGWKHSMVLWVIRTSTSS